MGPVPVRGPPSLARGDIRPEGVDLTFLTLPAEEP
jgi:hypothetical protein